MRSCTVTEICEEATYTVRSFGVPRSFVWRSTFWFSVSTSSFVRPASNSAASTASDFVPLASYAAPLSAPSDRIPNSMTASSGAVPTDAVDVTVIVRGGVGADAGFDALSPASAFAPNPTTSPTTNTSAIHPVRFMAPPPARQRRACAARGPCPEPSFA